MHQRSEADLARIQCSLHFLPPENELSEKSQNNNFFLVINSRRLFNIFIFGQKFWQDLLFFDGISYGTTREKQYIRIHIWRYEWYYMKNHEFLWKIVIFGGILRKNCTQTPFWGMFSTYFARRHSRGTFWGPRGGKNSFWSIYFTITISNSDDKINRSK